MRYGRDKKRPKFLGDNVPICRLSVIYNAQQKQQYLPKGKGWLFTTENIAYIGYLFYLNKLVFVFQRKNQYLYVVS